MRLREAGLATRQMAGQVVVLDHNESRYLTVGGAGALVFTLLQQERTREELVAALLERYDVDSDTAERDVDAFVGELNAMGLLATN